jgi:FkbM family methyltransferase
MSTSKFERSRDFGAWPLLRDCSALALMQRGALDRSILSELANLHFGDWSRRASDDIFKINVRCGERGILIALRRNPSDILTFAEIMLRGIYDRLLDNYRESRCTWIDIGAHVGLASLYASTRCLDLHGVCVEPIPSSAQLLQENLAMNRLNLAVERAAISDRDGFGKVYTTRWWSSCTTSIEVREGRLSNPRRPEHTHRAKDEIVRTINMSTLFQTHNIDSVDILKFDAEGAEAVVFERSCASWIKRVGRIGIDLHSRYINSTQILQRLTELGFVIQSRKGSFFVLDRRGDPS